MAEGFPRLREVSADVADIRQAREQREEKALEQIFERQQSTLAQINVLMESDDRRLQDIADKLLGELHDWIELARIFAGVSPERLANYIDEHTQEETKPPTAS